MRRKIVVAAKVEAGLLALLSSDARLDVSYRPADGEDGLIAAADGAEVLVTRTYNQVSRRVLEQLPALRVVAQATSGIDNIDVDAARERGIAVLHLPGINANAVAELVIGNLVALTRTVPLYTRQVLRGVWQRDDCTSRHELAHHRLGIIGLGYVGTRVARLAAAFRMRVTAYDPYISDAEFAARGALKRATLDGLLTDSDAVTLHVPLTPETRGMIGGEQLARMKRGTYLVNAARGEVLDTEAALAALRDGHLGGLALDVFHTEPPGREFPDDPRLILTPHIGGCTSECRAASSARLYERIKEWCAQQ